MECHINPRTHNSPRARQAASANGTPVHADPRWLWWAVLGSSGMRCAMPSCIQRVQAHDDINTTQAEACWSDMTAAPTASAKTGKGSPSDDPGAVNAHGPPAWRGMPEPRSVIVLSWEDVWLKLHEALGRQPTKEEVVSLFEEVTHHMDDALIEDFWIYIEQLAEHYNGQDKNCDLAKL